MKELTRIDLREKYSEYFFLWRSRNLGAQHKFCPKQFGLVLNFDGKLLLESTDGGKSWKPFDAKLPPSNLGMFTYPFDEDILIAFEDATKYYVSKNGGITWQGPRTIPTAEKQFSACKRPHCFSTLCTPGGYLVLASSYCLGVLEAEAEVLCCSVSDDWGASWKTGQLFWPPGNMPKAPEGFSEPAVVSLGSSNLWMVFRTPYGELWQSFSEDMGATWAPATPTGFVSPVSNCYAANLPDGSVVLVWNLCKPGMATDFRISKNSLFRPRNNLVFSVSRDNCRTWTVPVTVEEHQGQYPSVHTDDERMYILYQSYPTDDIIGWEQMGLTLVAYDLKEVMALKPWTRETMQPLVEQGLVAPWLALHVDKPLWGITD